MDGKVVYAASWNYGSPNLAKINVEKETPKTITVGEYETLRGYLYFGKRTMKNRYFFADTLAEALAWLLEKARKNVIRRREAAQKADELVIELETALQHMRS